MVDLRIERVMGFPGKGMRGYDLEYLLFGPNGLPEGDRLIMAVHPDGTMISQRTHPSLVLVEPALFGRGPGTPPVGVTLRAPSMCELIHPRDRGGRLMPVKIHRDWSVGVDQGREAAEWFTRFLGTPARLVWLPDDNQRRVDQVFADPTDTVGFADGWPVLVTGRESFLEFNSWLARPITEDRLRPTVVIGGLAPFMEEAILVLEIIGRNVILVLDKFNARCTVINVDPDTGEVDPEPLRVLAARHTLVEPTTKKRGAMFGVNSRIRTDAPGGAMIAVGDRVKVLQWR